MVAPQKQTAFDYFPSKLTYASLKRASEDCRGCDLYQNATQTVFGEGPTDAEVLFVGEQPGDEEDKTGHPFVGPAGRLLDKALAEAGIDRAKVYMTNAVKHFKWKQSGKRRLHEKPKASEIAACRPWLIAEIEVLQPTLVVCLGATAAQTLLGKDFRVTKNRGEWIPIQEPTARAMATVHPSSILRAPDAERRELDYKQFVADLTLVTRAMADPELPGRLET